jgi:hypothetical protein
MNASRPLLIAALALLAGPAAAQRLMEPIPGRTAPHERKMPPRAAQQNVMPCPEMGPGFVRVGGSSTCMRVSGQVRADTITRDRRSQLGEPFESRARGTVQVETRTPTDLGPVRLIYRQRFERPMSGS